MVKVAIGPLFVYLKLDKDDVSRFCPYLRPSKGASSFAKQALKFRERPVLLQAAVSRPCETGGRTWIFVGSPLAAHRGRCPVEVARPFPSRGFLPKFLRIGLGAGPVCRPSSFAGSEGSALIF